MSKCKARRTKMLEDFVLVAALPDYADTFCGGGDLPWAEVNCLLIFRLRIQRSVVS